MLLLFGGVYFEISPEFYLMGLARLQRAIAASIDANITSKTFDNSNRTTAAATTSAPSRIHE
jgi:hypothetical protein